ncbi:MAG: hypothetical protein K6C36_03255 [Clostridia bacterium]|nr:hypothetical protein [Clostridia bacterium]
MKYRGRVFGSDAELSIEREGVRLASRYVDFADVARLIPLNHRLFVELVTGEKIEISMLGFSFDGCWEELSASFASRSEASLFIEEELLMRCSGEFELPAERGRGAVALYPDAVVILPDSLRAVRIPLCFSSEPETNGYIARLSLPDGRRYSFGRMGYDTMPFFERMLKNRAATIRARAAALEKVPILPPFTDKGLFRTERPEQYWLAAFGRGVCAVELFVGEDAATYLYRFEEPREVFLYNLEAAMEAVGTHREIIFIPDEKIAQNPLYRMAVERCPAVGFLRSRSAGRLIHSADHSEKLRAFLEC